MKVWMLIPLVIFIAIAGYQFGYYHAKIDISDAQKERLAEGNSVQTPQVLADKIVHKVTAAEIPASTQKILESKKINNSELTDDAELEKRPGSASKVIDEIERMSDEDAARRMTQETFVDNYQDEDLDLEIATQITDFFALHPEGQKVYFHHVRCDANQCQLVGQFDGIHKHFEELIEEMQMQDWYSFGSTSSNISSDDAKTHFILHLAERKKAS